MPKYIIAVDAMGGDNAPAAVIEGAKLALAEMPDIEIALYGSESALSGVSGERLKCVHTTEIIEMEESPMLAVRKKTDSSMVRAMLAVRDGEADAALSAGSTGAVLACGMFRVGRIKGVERPALAPVLPGLNNPVMLIDSGANVDCQAKYLEQFGLMGAKYMELVMGVSAPKVGLINIGAEAEKGNKLVKEAYALMSAQSAYNFCGNVEARDILLSDVSVAVADGFAGNLVLKQTEGTAKMMSALLKEELYGSVRSKKRTEGKVKSISALFDRDFYRGLRSMIGALLLKPGLMRFKARMDYREYGGAPLLGVDGAIVKAHGSSDARAIRSAIKQAREMAKGGVAGKIAEGLTALTGDK